jgi:hypothetical protein
MAPNLGMDKNFIESMEARRRKQKRELEDTLAVAHQRYLHDPEFHYRVVALHDVLSRRFDGYTRAMAIETIATLELVEHKLAEERRDT